MNRQPRNLCSQATNAFITGAASGIGREFAVQMSRPGMRLHLADRDWGTRQREIIQVCEARGAAVETSLVDVGYAPGIGELVRDFYRRNGSIDVLFANAGIGAAGEPQATRDETFRINYFGAINTIEPVIELYGSDSRASIIVSNSIAACVATHGSGDYSASKSALRMWTDSLRLRLRGTGVLVTSVLYGFVDTPMIEGIHHAQRLKIPTSIAVRDTIRAVDGGRSEVHVPRFRNIPWRMLEIMPQQMRDGALAEAWKRVAS